MVEPKLLLPFILLSWIHLLLLVHHCAEAQSPPQPVLRSWDPSVIFISGALIIAFVVVGVLSIYLNRCFESHMTRPNPNRADWPCSCSQGIDPRVLDTFPILFYSAIKDLKFGKEALECAVCLSEFKDDETLRLLPVCNHVFHPDCIDAWLSSHVTCPVCRANLNRDSGEVAVAVETQLSNNETNEEGSGSRAQQGGGGGGGGRENEIEQYPVVPDANEGQSQSNGDEDDVGKQNRASKLKLLRKLRRSNSTGHSLVEPGKCVKRYTLRLPEDVRRYILLNHRRSASYNVVTPMLGSSRTGLCWSDSEGSSRGKRNNVVELRQERWTLSRS